MFRTFMDWLALRKTAGPSETAISLFSTAVEHARRPVFYERFGVPDTLDGRFDLLALHLFLIMRRLKRAGDSGGILAQQMADLLVTNLDETLREMGVGDLSVGKRVKAMVQAFYGRIAAYDRGLLAGDDSVLQDAVRRNLYRDAPPSELAVEAMASYIVRNERHFDALRNPQFNEGSVVFLPPEEIRA